MFLGGTSKKCVPLLHVCTQETYNRSSTTSVVVVSKDSGKYKEIKSFGSSSSEEDIKSLCNKAAAWIRFFGGQQELDFDNSRENNVTFRPIKRLILNWVAH